MGSVCSQILPGPVRDAEEDSVAAEDHVLDAGDRRDLKVDASLKGADVSGMHAEVLSGLRDRARPTRRRVRAMRCLGR